MTKIKESSTNHENKQNLSSCCSIIYATQLLSGLWTLAICCALENGKLRFCELKKSVPGITERMLTYQLRKMEANKLITRIVHAEVPPKVEYELTPITRELDPIVKELEAWGNRHKKII
ncbi:winged helix-turn-helix transcriptional regulator [Parapedobacter tibetensis]|uniref:winged helix-turn-helix transcriptional regulator n=1 Tax=Parapedobacter tibetensis TaxID=2972951 RepID=UPI00214DD639|nr:helix-turn-helix domain-containing protein [Parapedobacter tibetensis]